MEISVKVLKFRFHLIAALLLSVTLFSLVLLAPRFVSVLTYFWPLLLSTALFLLAVVVFGKTSLPATDGHSDKAGEGILNYVAGHPEHHMDSFKSD